MIVSMAHQKPSQYDSALNATLQEVEDSQDHDEVCFSADNRKPPD